MRETLAAAALSCLAMVAPSYGQQATTRDQIIGSWKVLSLKATTGNKLSYPLEEKVEGYVTITSGRIWLLFVDGRENRRRRRHYRCRNSIAMMKSQVAWTGKYVTGDQSSDGIKLTARVRRGFERGN